MNQRARASSSVVPRSHVKVSPARMTGSRMAHMPGQSAAVAGRISMPAGCRLDSAVASAVALTRATLAGGLPVFGTALGAL
ncbi:hypothetical protein FQZ97_1021950 [compost metagenome]